MCDANDMIWNHVKEVVGCQIGKDHLVIGGGRSPCFLSIAQRLNFFLQETGNNILIFNSQ